MDYRPYLYFYKKEKIALLYYTPFQRVLRGLSLLEEPGRQVALTGIGQNHHDELTFVF